NNPPLSAPLEFLATPRAALCDSRRGNSGAEVRPPPRTPFPPPRLTKLQMVPDECGTQRAACIAGSGLYVRVLEAAIAQHLAVRNAVERNASGKTQVPNPGFGSERSRQTQHDLVGHRLDGRGQVHV